MKKACLLLLFPLLLLAACGSTSAPSEPSAATPESIPATVVTLPRETVALSTEAETTSPAEPVIYLTEEEKNMLLKIGMAERGNKECTECIALVMRTVLNRVESHRFGSSIHSVIFAQDQFTPVTDGSYYSAEPNTCCYEALDWILYGWDESQGALFYEWCTGESWHSQNLHLLFQHCDTRFYD